MHDSQLVHNDVKPANLFLNAQGDVLLGDLGYASSLDAQGRAHLRGGTPGTMSPEAAIAALTRESLSKAASKRSDIYSLGALFYWLVTGAAPYVGSHDYVLRQVRDNPPLSLKFAAPHVPNSLVRVVTRAMSRTEEDRYETAAGFDYALAAAPLPSREWAPLPAHTGHDTCYVGVRSGKQDLQACVSTNPAGMHDIRVSYVSSDRQKGLTNNVRPSRLATVLRSVFRGHN